MLDKANLISEKIVAWRRDIHRNPELGFQEIRTAGVVAEALNDLGYRVRTGVGNTGVVGEIGSGKPVVAIRADMDALPIQEAEGPSYRSVVPGVMHACGHDTHTAIALGVATLLKDEDFPGTVRFLFQPAEETADEEGVSGAPRMIEDGAMEGVDAVLALHIASSIKAGTVTLSPDVGSAGVDTFLTTITGQGGHGAMPHTVIDPIHIAGHVILALHGIVSRKINPVDQAVISIGTVHAGTADNIIPEKVEITGTIRFLTKSVQKTLHEEILRALDISRVLGGDYENEFEIGFPPMGIDQRVNQVILEVYKDLTGEDAIIEKDTGMGAEDFSFMTQLAPGSMFMLGGKIEDDERRHHDPRFDIDEKAFPVGAAVLAESALRILRGGLE